MMIKFSPKNLLQLISKNKLDEHILAEHLLASFSEEALLKGLHQVEETTVLWVVLSFGEQPPVLLLRTFTQDGAVWHEWEAPHPEPRPDILATNTFSLPLHRLGESDLYIHVQELPNYSASAYRFEAGGKRISAGSWVVLEHFPTDPDSLPQPGVPQGTVQELILRSQVIPGTVRGYWVYIPVQTIQEDTPACWMVFQDGGMYLEPPASVPIVFDNLIYKKEMPPTVGIFVNPGTFPEQEGRFQNRITEYHTQSDQYARMLRDEIIPEVSKLALLRPEASAHAIAGISSGAVCAFNAAWQMPDYFSKVLSHVGSYTNIIDSHQFPFMIRMNERKPIRIWLQDGSNDIDDVCGNWSLANQQMAAALKFRNYDVHFEYSRGFHSLAHGGATLPQALKWLWRDEG
jgi:enterochelin esterase family protein